MKKTVILIIILVMTMCLSGCKEEIVFPTDKIVEVGNLVQEAAIPKYDVTIQVDCTENLFMNKYDVEVSAANEVLGVLEHGKAETYELELEEGTYTFSVCEESDDEELADGKVEFTINEDKALKFEVYCRTDQIEITEIPSVNPPIVSSELTGQKYKKIVQMYKDAGFENVEAKPVRELDADNLNKKSKVKRIFIDKDSKFTKEDKFFIDSKVVVRYYAPTMVKVPASSYDLDDKPYEEVISKFEKAGFIDVTTITITTSDSSIKNGAVSDVEINEDDSFDKGDKFPLDSEVVITYFEFVASEEDDEWDESWDAKMVFEDYGQTLYPYGFEPKWVIGLINTEKWDDGSWFIKVEVEIKNQYGEKYDAIAEGRVLGNSVIDFYVH